MIEYVESDYCLLFLVVPLEYYYFVFKALNHRILLPIVEGNPDFLQVAGHKCSDFELLVFRHDS